MMEFNREEYEAVKKRVTQRIADTYDIDSAREEVIGGAYEELYGAFDTSDDSDEFWARANRMDDYMIDLLQALNREFVEDAEFAHRSFELFVEVAHNTWAYYRRKGDKNPWVCVGWGLGSYSAVEYDDDGGVTHYGTGETPQEALYNMRLVLNH